MMEGCGGEPTDEEEEEILAADREDARLAIIKRWIVDREDWEDGVIAYRIYTDDYSHRICLVADSDNPTAKRDLEHIVELHNASLGKGKP